MRTALLLVVLVIFVIIVFPGCTQETPRDRFQLTVVYVADEAELRAACGNDMIVEPLGCAKRVTGKCSIFAYRPRGFDDHRRLETLGHELLHCISGPVHT